MDAIRDRIISYMRDIMKMDESQIVSVRRYSLEKYGTTLMGLVELFNIDKQEYLQYVHNLNLEDFLKPDPEIRYLLLEYPQKKVIFSNADTNHVRRVLDYLDLCDCFERIIDVHLLMPYVKPQTAAFNKALKAINLDSWDGCVFIDDYMPNVQKAIELEIFSVLIDETNESLFKNKISSILDLPRLIPKRE